MFLRIFIIPKIRTGTQHTSPLTHAPISHESKKSFADMIAGNSESYFTQAVTITGAIRKTNAAAPIKKHSENAPLSQTMIFSRAVSIRER